MKTSLPIHNYPSPTNLARFRRLVARLGCALGLLLAAPALFAQSYYPNLFDISIYFGCHCGCGCNTNALDTNNPVSRFLSTTPVVAVQSSSAFMPPVGEVVPPHFSEFLPSCSPPLYGGSSGLTFAPEGWTVTQSRINAYGYTPYEPVSFTLNHPLQFNLLDYWFYGDVLPPDPLSATGDAPIPTAATTQCQPYPWDVNLTLQLQDGQSYVMEQQLVTGYAPDVNGVQMETPVNYLETNGLLTVSLYCTNGGTTNIILVSGANITASLLPVNIPAPLDQTVGWLLTPNFFTNWDWPLSDVDTADPGGPAGAANTVQAALSMGSGSVDSINLEQTNLLVRANRAYALSLSYMLDGYNIETLVITNTGIVPPCTNLQLVFYTDVCSITPPTNHINQQLCYATNVGLVDMMGPPNDAGAPQNDPGITIWASGDGNLFDVPLTGAALSTLPAPFVLPVFLINETTTDFSKWATENLGLGAAYEYFRSPTVSPLVENCYETNNLTNDFVMCPGDPALVKGTVSMCGPLDTNYYGGIGALSTLQFAVTPPPGSGNSAGLPYDPTVSPFPVYNSADPADPELQHVSTILATGGASAAPPFNTGGGSAITEFDSSGAFTGPDTYQGNYTLELAGLESQPSTWNASDLHLVFGSPVNLDYHVDFTGAPYDNINVSCGTVKTNDVNLCFGLVTIPVVNVYPQPIPAGLIYTTLYLQVTGAGPGYTVGPISTNGFAFQYTSQTHNEADVQMFLPEGTYQYSATVKTAGGSYLSLGTTNSFTVTCGCGTTNATPGTNTCTNGCITISNPNNIVVNSCTNVPVYYTPVISDLCCSNVTVVCNPPSGSWFAPGTTTTVTTVATDSCGSSNECTFTVTVQCGTTVNTNTCTNNCITIVNPNDMVINSCTNTPVYYTPTVTDACCSNLTLACYPPSGSVFAPNTTNMVVTVASDSCGHSNFCTFMVTVQCGPVAGTNTCTNGCITIFNPNNIVMNSCTNVPVYYSPTVTDACCSNLNLVCYPPSGSWFAPGTTTVTTVAMDSCGHSNLCTFEVTIECPASTNCCANCTAPYPISFTNLVNPGYSFLADNLCQGASNTINNVLTNVPSGTVLLLWDFATQSYSQDYTYLDAADAAPMPAGWYDSDLTTLSTATLSPGEGFILDNPGSTFQLVIQGCDPGCTPPCAPPAGGQSLVGSYGVEPATWTNLFSCPPPCGAEMELWNGSGFNIYNYANGAWTPSLPMLAPGASAFVLVDTNVVCCSMEVTCPSNIVVSACTNEVVTYPAPTVTDTCCTNWNFYYTPPSGSSFPVGTNMVTCVVVDSCGHTNSCNFSVTVECGSSDSQGSPVLHTTATNQILNLNWTYQPYWRLQNSTDLVHWAFSSLTSPPPVQVSLSATNLVPMQFYRLMFQSNAP